MARRTSEDDIEKLMEIAASSDKPIKHDNPEVLKFIEECGITSGTEKVATWTIYYRYYQWKENKKRLINRTPFFKEFIKHFDHKLVSNGRVYFLNAEPFDLTTTGYFAARALLRRERYARQKAKEKNQKKQ
jgi:hypothetical protein